MFGRGAVTEANELLDSGYTLLSTPRAAATVPELVAGAGAVHEVGAGRVDELAGALRAEVDGQPLVALGAFAASASPEDPGGRDALALAALLAGYVIGSTGYGLHHVLAQTLARFTEAGHGGANALVLPHSLRLLRSRSPDSLQRLDLALGEDASDFAARLCALTGTSRLREAGVTEAELDHCAGEASGRRELHLTPPAADRDELRALYQAAF